MVQVVSCVPAVIYQLGGDILRVDYKGIHLHYSSELQNLLQPYNTYNTIGDGGAMTMSLVDWEEVKAGHRRESATDEAQIPECSNRDAHVWETYFHCSTIRLQRKKIHIFTMTVRTARTSLSPDQAPFQVGLLFVEFITVNGLRDPLFLSCFPDPSCFRDDVMVFWDLYSTTKAILHVSCHYMVNGRWCKKDGQRIHSRVWGDAMSVSIVRT